MAARPERAGGSADSCCRGRRTGLLAGTYGDSSATRPVSTQRGFEAAEHAATIT
jgi:hypothetical protein